MNDLRVGNPLVIGDVTLVPIERCVLHAHVSDSGCWLSGFKEPVAIIVWDALGFRALDIRPKENPAPSPGVDQPAA